MSVRERIMAALRGSGRPMTANALAVRVGYEHPPSWWRGRLDDLVTEGCLSTCNGCSECGNGRKYTLKAT